MRPPQTSLGREIRVNNYISLSPPFRTASVASGFPTPPICATHGIPA